MDAQSNTKGLILLTLIYSLLIQEAYAGIGLKPLDFFRLGDKELTKEIKIIFHPQDGIALRKNYEKKYGVRGEDLIKSLGEGLNVATLNQQTESLQVT